MNGVAVIKCFECSEDEGYGQWETIAENNSKKGKNTNDNLFIIFK